ncbi:hypothetical protein B0T17DRAFT_590495 [Bombardia bombarda]|uniref:Small ribosomal subunit protein mS38 n=1 Tax=Bombardia bombarda TaxID=252184 RepID=A0AA40C4C5_9PEZI|nr:hypothetical protein B0T17DRAFT_590495 [Bombardia bombarda]
MLPSSLRRVAVAAAAPQSPIVSSLASSAPRVAAAAAVFSRPYTQRRYSSSKPSSSDDGSRDYRPSVPSSGEKRKRKAKDNVAVAPQLPSVPSTRHIKDEALALSTFFALHRPISVTQLLPQTVTDEAFAEIFNTRGHGVTDVLSTLSQSVHDLEQPLSKLNMSSGDKRQQQQFQQQEQREAEEERSGNSNKLTFRLGGSSDNASAEASFYITPNSASGHFLPYTPPPAPEPVSDAQQAQADADAIAAEEAAEAAEAAEQQPPQTRVYKAIVTIEETVDADGQYKVVAHSPQLVDDDGASLSQQPRSFLERMALRQIRHEDARQQLRDRTVYAISVRRQKKLKMKKKKYKKLMRRTRNERRKLDRL